ncbi:MAG TPA: type VI secretion system contractile sheath large subunit [Acetobacteraceae bacterium]|nr:type VI secretion system contractile sheath large subunit [Acetobacteraceae bacterium]
MDYQVSFGRLGRTPRAAPTPRKFRLALLGDFSGRANAGRLDTGAELARRKPVKVDVDNLDDVLTRYGLALTLPIAEDGSAFRVQIGAIDDFHPDQLAENLDVFGQLRDLRRNLGSRAGFDRAAKEVLSWGGEAPLPPPPRKARGAAVATTRLSDFARLIGRPATATAAEGSVDDLVRRLVGPLIQPARDARQDALIARVDEALSAAMRRVLHHPDFQTAEALWRGVEFLVRRIETGAQMEIVLYDVSAEELAADLAATDALEQTGLYGMLVEQPALDAHQGPLSAVIGFYGFELAPPHADLLGRVAQIAAAAGAPFVAGIGPDALKIPFHDQHPLIKDAFTALYGLPAAAYLGLATPRFLLRMPYGRKTDPIDAFGFEEFTRQGGLSGMLWGHPALIPALLLAETYAQQGAKMKLGAVMGVGDIPYYVYVDTDGEQIALPCTERLYTERQAVELGQYRVMPLLSLRGRPELRLGGFTSLAGTPLAGFWAPVEIKPAPEPAKAPEPAAKAPEPEPVAAEPEPVPDPEPAAAGEPEPAAPETEVAGAAQPEPAPPPEEPAAAEPAEAPDLDALLAGLSTDAAAPAAAPDAPADSGDELDKLLASLNADTPPAAADETEADLDALLESLK